jgi:hypothetical protein
LHDNPVTKSKKCPPGFVPQSLFDSNDNFICQSADFSVQNIRYIFEKINKSKNEYINRSVNIQEMQYLSADS